MFAPGIKIKNDFMLRFVDCLVQLIVNVTVSGIKPIVPCHLEIFFRDMLDKQFYKINGGKSFSYKCVVFVSVVMESHVIAVIGINSG